MSDKPNPIPLYRKLRDQTRLDLLRLELAIENLATDVEEVDFTDVLDLLESALLYLEDIEKAVTAARREHLNYDE